MPATVGPRRRPGRAVATLVLSAVLGIALPTVVTAEAAAVQPGTCADGHPTWGSALLCSGADGIHGLTVDDTARDGHCVQVLRTVDGLTWTPEPGARSCGSPVYVAEFDLMTSDVRWGIRLSRGDGRYSTVCDGTDLPVRGKPDC